MRVSFKLLVMSELVLLGATLALLIDRAAREHRGAQAQTDDVTVVCADVIEITQHALGAATDCAATADDSVTPAPS